jgi:hypothetical protein
MNPKTPQDLDPKLKEAYDRVMGGNFTQPVPPTVPEKPEPVPPASVNPMTMSAPMPNPLQADNPPVNVMSPTSTPQNGDKVLSAKKKTKLTPLLFLIVGLVFFLVYALVWGRLFKLI